MAQGLPSINISFQQEGISAIKRGARGIVALILKDTKAVGNHTIFDVTDIPSELGEENKDLISQALIGNTNAPKRVELFVLGADGELSNALDYFEVTKFDYLAYPKAESEDKTAIKSWIKALRDNEGIMAKVVLAKENGDHEGIINVTQDGVVIGGKTYNAGEFTARVAGLIAGTDLRIATTYANLTDVTEIPFEKKLSTSEKIANGEFVLFKEAGKIKVARGVNSLISTSQVKGEAFQKIKLVDIMDLISNDIRETARENYLGKYANSYDNKCLLITAISGYFDGLINDGLVERNTVNVGIDLDAQKAYLKSVGNDISEWTEQQIKEANTADKVFISVKCKILDAIEEINVKVMI